ncbi:hypothetical protein ACPCYY_21010, partial [Bacillus pumilus]
PTPTLFGRRWRKTRSTCFDTTVAPVAPVAPVGPVSPVAPRSEAHTSDLPSQLDASKSVGLVGPGWEGGGG